MAISFSDFYQRILKSTSIVTQMDLADALGVNRSAITQAKKRGEVPPKWILCLSRKFNISPDWLEFGTETTIFDSYQDDSSPLHNQFLYIPKVQATLSAGGGSFEVEAVPVTEYPLPKTWLSRMGNAQKMVFMDVIGNSMTPSICDGDMVLVDQSVSEFESNAVMAVGYEDTIYIKRIIKKPNEVVLLSDNADYDPITISGDELHSLRVIGRVVWLCRDCRYA